MNDRPIGPQIEGLTFVQHLGSGGYSDVYLYVQRRPKMRVAVKVLTNTRLSEAELSRFADEAETMAELADHPFIVQVFRMGATDDGRPYLVMKFYPPPNLGARAATHPLTVAEMLRTGIQIASAVETAHRAGILHRDIKPANILVSQFGTPGLADFGIAGKSADTDGDDELGVSIPWSPPEILSGSSNGSVSSDVYSLAASLWHLLAGRSPFEVLGGGDNSPRALIGRIHRAAPPATGRADAPASLERVLQQGMAKDPKMRPASALELARQLQAVEQELRYASTPIVVDGDAGQRPATAQEPSRHVDAASEASGMSSESWAPRADDSGFRPSPQPSTTRRPVRPIIPVSEPRPPAAGAAVAKAEPPTLRPDRSTDLAPQPTFIAPPRPTAAGGPETEELTRGRPTAAQIATLPVGGVVEESLATTVRPVSLTTDPAPPAVRRRSKTGAVLTGVVASIAALVVAIALLGGNHSPKSTGSQTSPPPLGSDQGGFGPDAVAAPRITSSYDAGSHRLTFRWSVPGRTSGQYYTYSVNGSSLKGPTTATSTSVTTSDPRNTCITVGSVSSDGTRHLAPQVCG